MSLLFGEWLCMYEVLFDDSFLKDIGVIMFDFVKVMIDEGYYLMIMYFLLVVYGVMLIELMELESWVVFDLFIVIMWDLVMSV